MMRPTEISKTIQAPDDVEVAIEGRKVTVKGNKGILTRDFSYAPISIAINGKTVRVWAEWPRKKEAALVGTIYSHIQNMINGVKKGFTYPAVARSNSRSVGERPSVSARPYSLPSRQR